MDRKKLMFIVSISTLALIYSFALFNFGVYLGKRQVVPPVLTATIPHYVVKEYNNKIAVFENDSPTPIKFLNVDINSLRKQDRIRFQEGIVVDNQKELAKLEEDFSS